MTNGYWAGSVQKAKEELLPMRDVGLTRFGLSIDDFHIRKVGLARLRNAVEAMLDLGLRFSFKFTSFKNKRSLVACLGDFQDLLDGSSNATFDIHAFRAIPVGRARLLSDEHFFFMEDLPKGACGAGKFTLMPDGRVMACCSAFGAESRLVVGAFPEHSFEDLDARYRSSDLLRALFIEGPAHFASALDAAGYATSSGQYTHICDLCRCVMEEGAADPRKGEVLREVAQAWRAERDFEQFTLLPLLEPFLGDNRTERAEASDDAPHLAHE